MEPEQSARLEYIPEHLATGVAILDCASLRIRYVNSYLRSLLDEPWRTQNPQSLTGRTLEETLPGELLKVALPLIQHACSIEQKVSWTDVPYEGFLAARGRTYWNVTIEPVVFNETKSDGQQRADSLLITLEEVTELARSRVYLNAIQYISSAISGPHALPLVLDRILQSVQGLVGSTRCAVLLLDTSVSGYETHGLGIGGYRQGETQAIKPPTVVIAAQKGVHLRSQDWRPLLSEQVLLGRVMHEGRTLVIEDTSTVPEMSFPLLDDEGTPRRPGSVLCVPIFEPQTGERDGKGSIFNTLTSAMRARAVIGTIEVYHRRARGFPAEEVVLLEQFAQQAGLAIQHARLFRRINRLARDATRSARQQKNVMQAIPDGVIIYDHRWRVADINLTVRTLLGWSDDIIGLPIAEALSRSTAVFESDFRLIPNLITELDRRAMNRQVDEFKLTGADRQEYVIRRSYAPILDELGNVFAFIVIYHDVTEQARTRERIEAEVVARTSELAQRNEALQLARAAQELESARMELLLERLPSGVMLISASDRRMTLINDRAAQLLQRMGLSGSANGETSEAAETANRNIGDSAIEELFRSFTVYGNSGTVVPYEEQPLFLALHEGRASEAELHLTEQDGQPLYLLMSAAALRDTDGTIASAVLVLHEITRIKTLERAREDFFTTMAHELKTPLANIRAHLSALQANDYQWSPDEQHDFLQTADEQVERLVRMINHFLDASRVEAGALRLELEPILLPEMVEDLQERLEALIATSRRRLEVSLSPHLPAVLGDYELIMSVLTNLLSNAFRYAPEGDAVRLEIEHISNGGNGENSGNGGNGDNQRFTSVELRVIDRGPGMSPQQQSELFTRFSTFAAMRRPDADSPGQPEVERRKTGTRWSPASGLGLYISRGIVEAHGSTLSLQSAPDEGAIFRFSLAVASGVPSEVG